MTEKQLSPATLAGVGAGSGVRSAAERQRLIPPRFDPQAFMHHEVLTEIVRPNGEVLRVFIETHIPSGRRTVKLQVWFEHGGEMRPTRPLELKQSDLAPVEGALYLARLKIGVGGSTK